MANITDHQTSTTETSSEEENDQSLYLTLSEQQIEVLVENRGKMQIARHIVNHMISKNVPTKERPSILIKVMTTAVPSMTIAGCRTYYNLIKKMLNGEDMYKNHKTYNTKYNEQKRKKRISDEQALTTKVLQTVIELQEKQPVSVDLSPSSPDSEITEQTSPNKRWGIMNLDTQQLIDSFTKRDVARQYNKELKNYGQNTAVVDNQKTDQSNIDVA